MSKAEKLLTRFLSTPTDFTFVELTRLLLGFGYEEIKTGRTSGSRVAFYNPDLDDMIKLHKPHTSAIVRQCYLRDIKKHLKDRGAIR